MTAPDLTTERGIQREAVRRLRDAGYAICVTSNAKKTSNTRGTPDVFLLIADGYWIAMDFKNPDGKLSPEQEALAAEKAIGIIRSVDEALAYVVKKEAEYARRGRIEEGLF